MITARNSSLGKVMFNASAQISETYNYTDINCSRII